MKYLIKIQLKCCVILLSSFFLVANHSFAQKDQAIKMENALDTTFSTYLAKLRGACVMKDTASLHALIGDTCFGYSCYGGEYPTRSFSSDWLIFANHYQLLKDPSTSTFWNLLLILSKNGAYEDSLTNKKRIPSFNEWGLSFEYTLESRIEMPGFFDAIPIDEHFIVFKDEQLKIAKETIHISVVEYFKENKDHWKFVPYDNFLFQVFKGKKLKGFISVNDMMYWNLQFEFDWDAKNKKWYLSYYEVC